MVPTSPITSRPIDNVEPYTMHNGKMVRQHTSSAFALFSHRRGRLDKASTSLIASGLSMTLARWGCVSCDQPLEDVT